MKLENDLGRDPIGRLVLRIAVPSMLAQLVSVLYSIVDRMYLGNIPEIGSLALAGAGVCGPAVTLISSFAFLVGIGGAPMVSVRMGGGRVDEAKKILANCFLLLCVLSAVLTAGALAVRRPLLLLFGASPDTLPYAMDYFTIYVCGTIFALLATGMNQFVICQGFARKGMESVVLGAVLNIALDPLFIFTLDMGVRGAAIATVLSQMGSCAYVLRFLFSKTPLVPITFGGYRWATIGRVVTMGLAPFLMYAIESLMVIGLNAVLQRHGGASGDQLVAAATIAQSFLLVVIMPLGGITGGTGAILGYNFGAGRPDRIQQAERCILALCVAYTGLLFLAAQVCAVPFTRIFTPDAQVSALAAQAIRLCTLGIVPLAFQYVVVDGFTGMGMMQYSLPLSLVRKAVYFGALFALPVFFGAPAAFLAEAVSDSFPPLISSLVFWRRRSWVRNRALEHRPALQTTVQPSRA